MQLKARPSPPYFFIFLLAGAGQVREPYVRMEIYTPTEYTGALMELCQARRGEFKEVKYLTAQRNSLVYELPLAEVQFPPRRPGPLPVLDCAPGALRATRPCLSAPTRLTAIRQMAHPPRSSPTSLTR